jgi:hypothetical protein
MVEVPGEEVVFAQRQSHASMHSDRMCRIAVRQATALMRLGQAANGGFMAE